MAIRLIDPKSIKVAKRFRKDNGDISALKASIQELGELLHPIVVDSEMKLIAGGRRLKAVKELKWDSVRVNVVNSLNDAVLAIKAERDENTCRKDLVPSEAVALGMQLEKLEKPAAKERQSEGQKEGGRGRKKLGGKKPPSKTRDKVGESVGMSGRTYEKAKEVVQSGNTEAIAEMDKNGKVGPAHNKVKQQKKIKELQEKAESVETDGQWQLIHGDCVSKLKSLDEYARLIFADPPYNIGVDYGDGKKSDQLEPGEYIAWCRKWIKASFERLSDDGSFWLLVSDEYAAELCIETKKHFHLRSWIKWFEGFGVNCSNNFNRTTRHIFWFVADPKKFVFHSHEVMRPSDRQSKYKDKRASSGGKIENDLWDIPRLSGTCNERIPKFPTQIPIAITDRIVRCASDPGDLVIDPFNGSGSTGVAAIRNGRRYVGIEKNEDYLKLSEARLKADGRS